MRWHMNCFAVSEVHAKRPTIMSAFSPELAEHWRASQGLHADDRSSGSRSDDSLSPAQQEAWEELAERVSAARSVY